MRDFSQNHDWLSINTATVRKQSGAEVPLDRIIDQCAARDIRAISPWRDQVA
ncbi:MAG: sugar phosphate isomerase/epimerase, partial [Ramlibacter sp.]